MSTDASTLKLVSPDGKVVMCQLYLKEAPNTCRTVLRALPLEIRFVSARHAGEEIWSPEPFSLQLEAENATANIKAGEFGYAPRLPRNMVGGSFVISYGETKLSEWINVFGIVSKDDLDTLKAIGESIWLGGAKVLRLESVR